MFIILIINGFNFYLCLMPLATALIAIITLIISIKDKNRKYNQIQFYTFLDNIREIASPKNIKQNIIKALSNKDELDKALKVENCIMASTNEYKQVKTLL